MRKWLCVDENGTEYMHDNKMNIYNREFWYKDFVNIGECRILPKGTIEKLLGYRLTHDCLPAMYGDKDDSE